MKITKLLIATATAASLSVPAMAEELSFASFVGPLHTITASVIDVLAASVSDATGGDLTVRAYPGGELGAGPVEQYIRVVQGVADMSWGLQGYTSSQFPRTMLIELPGAMLDGAHGYDMLWDAYEGHLASEFPGTKPLALWVSEPNIMIMKDIVIRTPADLEGLKIRVAGAVAADVATALGATPVQMPITQVYNALQTGLIDGVFTGASTLSDFKLDEVADAITVGAPLGVISFYAVMSQERYDGLTADQQAAIDAASGRALSQSAEDAWITQADANVVTAIADSNNTVVELSADEIAAFSTITMSISAQVIDSVGGGAEALAAMQGE
ncbi:MAG: TRAP transporter substrate-binding protein [Rhodobacteraceae bacterium]|nr:TRAP transporter substrate-binding protein [Paracoccaceae bacterium]